MDANIYVLLLEVNRYRVAPTSAEAAFNPVDIVLHGTFVQADDRIIQVDQKTSET